MSDFEILAGNPSPSEPMDRIFALRVGDRRLALYRRMAALEGMDLSNWMRNHLDRRVARMFWLKKVEGKKEKAAYPELSKILNQMVEDAKTTDDEEIATKYDLPVYIVEKILGDFRLKGLAK